MAPQKGREPDKAASPDGEAPSVPGAVDGPALAGPRRESAANNLRYALHVTCKTLEIAPGTALRYLQLQGEQVALYPEGPLWAALWVDIRAFEEAVATPALDG